MGLRGFSFFGGTMANKRYGGWTDRDTTKKGYADLDTRFSSYNTKAEGTMVLDGVADDRAAFSTLVNVTMQPNGGICDIVGVVRIASNMSIPANVELRFLGGAYLAPDVGVPVGIAGTFDTSLRKKFGGAGTFTFGSKVREFFAEWWGAVGDGVADDTPSFLSVAATGRPLCLLAGSAYRVNSPVAISADIRGGGLGTGESAVVLTGTGQLVTGDDNLHWTGFHIRSAVNGLTFIKVMTNSFRMDDFVMEGTGGAINQVGFQFDTTFSIYFASITKFRIMSVAFPMKVTGIGNFNNNHLGEPGDHWLQFTDAVTFNNTNAPAVNTIEGYFETGSGSVIKTTVALRFSTFNIYLDNVPFAINTSVNITVNNFWFIDPSQFLPTGAGNLTNQTFAALITVVPPQIAVDQNDYNPAGLATADSLLLNSSAAKNITGLVAPMRGGALLSITNNGNFAITLKQNAVASAAGNRFLLKGGADAVLPSDSGIMLVYGVGAWREVLR